MAIFGALTALLKSDNTSWRKGFKEARKDVDDTADKTKGFFKNLNKSFGGSGSGVAQAFKIAMGGGAAGVMSMALREATNAVSAINELNNAYAAATISAGEYWEKVAESIPILGEGWKLGRMLRESLTHEERDAIRAAKASDERTAAITRSTNAMYAYAKSIRLLIEDDKVNAKNLSQEVALLSTKDELQRAIKKATFDKENATGAQKEKDDSAIHQDRLDQLKKNLHIWDTRRWGDPGNPYGGSGGIERMNRERLELEQLENNKRVILRESAGIYININKKAELEIAQLREDASKKAMKDQIDAARKAADVKIDNEMRFLEDSKEKLKQLISEGKESLYEGPAQTRQMRRTNFVQLGPTIDNPQAKAAEAAVTQLKSIDARLKTLNEKKDKDDGIAVNF